MLVERILNDDATAPERVQFRALCRDDPVAAKSAIVTCLNAAPRYDAGAGYLMGALCEALAFARVEDPVALVEDALGDLEAFRDTKEFMIMEGGARMLAGDRIGAYSIFKRSQDAPGEFYFPAHRGVHNIVEYDSPDWLDPAPRRKVLGSPLRWVAEGKASDLTVLCSGDRRYFRYFAKAVLEGLATSVTPVHFHIVGWNEECDALAKTLSHPGGVSITTEEYGYGADYTYFATARFFRAVDLMRTLGPLYISDLDNQFVKPPESVRDALRRYDCAFNYNVWHERLPWLSPNAGYVFINNTRGGLKFAQSMQNYIDHRFQPNSGRSWYFDQLLINENIRAVEPNAVALNRRTMPSGSRPKEEMRYIKNLMKREVRREASLAAV